MYVLRKLINSNFPLKLILKTIASSVAEAVESYSKQIEDEHLQLVDGA